MLILMEGAGLRASGAGGGWGCGRSALAQRGGSLNCPAGWRVAIGPGLAQRQVCWLLSNSRDMWQKR